MTRGLAASKQSGRYLLGFATEAKNFVFCITQEEVEATDEGLHLIARHELNAQLVLDNLLKFVRTTSSAIYLANFIRAAVPCVMR